GVDRDPRKARRLTGDLQVRAPLVSGEMPPPASTGAQRRDRRLVHTPPAGRSRTDPEPPAWRRPKQLPDPLGCRGASAVTPRRARHDPLGPEAPPSIQRWRRDPHVAAPLHSRGLQVGSDLLTAGDCPTGPDSPTCARSPERPA